MNHDQLHLRLLSIFHYVLGGILGLVACAPIIPLVLTMLLLPGGVDPQGGPRNRDVGALAFFSVAALVDVAIGMMAIAMLLAGRSLAARRNYTSCLAVAGVECLLMPFGTVLGVFTIIVLLRPSVEARFERPVERATTLPSGGEP
jgi:hypothetical protein